MTLYKRIPKTLWQRVWFKIRPKVVEAIEFQDAVIKNGNVISNGVYKCGDKYYAKDWFEANFEPVEVKTSESGL